MNENDLIQKKEEADLAYLDFLEHELLRLEKMKDFIKNKVPTKRLFSQTALLLDQEKKLKESLKHQLLDTLMDRESLFQKNMEVIFDRLFKEYD